jgi:flagella basal body P-ring formation protein FlgA
VIRSVAAQFARDQIDTAGLSAIQAQAAELDPRLNLAECDVPLEAFATARTRQLARTTVGVKCTGAKPWTLYVPVTIDALADVVFTRRPLLRGEALTADALEIRQLPIAKLPLRHISSPEQLTGMETTRPLQADTAVTLNALRARQLVKQGQEVGIVAVSGGIQVRMSGVAMRSGSRGDRIPVQNHSSGRQVEAEILDRSTVRVNF